MTGGARMTRAQAADASRLIFQTIGSPIGTGRSLPSADVLEGMTEFIFKSRVGLLFLEECARRGVVLGPKALALLMSLRARRAGTDRVVAKLARRLDEVAAGEWVLFKSIKPFAATPNDTDWFPFEARRHRALVAHLLADGGFHRLEAAPRQITLIEAGGLGRTDTTKRGGVHYVDCYVAPSTDYFIYLDPRRMRGLVTEAEVSGQRVPVLQPHVELAAILFHNVFPERSFSIESYYLVKGHLDRMEAAGLLEAFVPFCRAQKVEFACAANLVLVREIDRVLFGLSDGRIEAILRGLGHAGLRVGGVDPLGAFPVSFPNAVFWWAFLSKQRDRTAFRSTLTQGFHMLNPIFLADVLQVLWKRSVRGGVYEQN